jgi:hypothetical protein
MNNIDLLLEKYLDTIKHGSQMYDVFINPDKKELRELSKAGGSGYRFIIDFDTKQIYVMSASSMIHYDMFSVIKDIKKITTWEKYHREASSRLFTGDCDENDFKNINSDTFILSFRGMRKEDRLKNLKELRSKDFSWLSKWMNPKEITDIIDNAIYYQEEKN